MVGQLEPHRRPGVCIALIGFLPLFAGIMTVAVTKSAGDKSDKTLKGLGPACLTIGSLTVLGGFLLQFVKHKMWKSKMENKTESDKKKTYSAEDPANQPGTSGTSNSGSHSNSRPIQIVARSSIEEGFDDIQEMKETWEDDVDEDEVVDYREETRVTEMAKVRTIEDELKEMEKENRAYENPVMKRVDIGDTPLPGTMEDFNDSD